MFAMWLPLASTPQYGSGHGSCSGILQKGQWIGKHWVPANCHYSHFDLSLPYNMYVHEMLRGRRIVFIGDSHTRNLYAQLEKQLGTISTGEEPQKAHGLDFWSVHPTYNITLVHLWAPATNRHKESLARAKLQSYVANYTHWFGAYVQHTRYSAHIIQHTQVQSADVIITNFPEWEITFGWQQYCNDTGYVGHYAPLNALQALHHPTLVVEVQHLPLLTDAQAHAWETAMESHGVATLDLRGAFKNASGIELGFGSEFRGVNYAHPTHGHHFMGGMFSQLIISQVLTLMQDCTDARSTSRLSRTDGRMQRRLLHGCHMQGSELSWGLRGFSGFLG
jgi:hypothetical protein